MKTEEGPLRFQLFGGVEKAGIVAILILAIANFLINQKDIALGILVGGFLFIVDFTLIKFLVNGLIGKVYSTAFIAFLFILKIVILLVILGLLILFAKLNIYGFIIALTALVLVIIGAGLKGSPNGSF